MRCDASFTNTPLRTTAVTKPTCSVKSRLPTARSCDLTLSLTVSSGVKERIPAARRRGSFRWRSHSRWRTIPTSPMASRRKALAVGCRGTSNNWLVRLLEPRAILFPTSCFRGPNPTRRHAQQEYVARTDCCTPSAQVSYRLRWLLSTFFMLRRQSRLHDFLSVQTRSTGPVLAEAHSIPIMSVCNVGDARWR